MKQINLTLSLIALLLAGACSNSTSDPDEEYYTEEHGFEDGTYCAQVEYYNPNTGTRSEYTLNVDVESNELVLIHWANGGWLDEDHFYPVELDSDGYCEFTSDKEYEYTVSITGPECSFTDENFLMDEMKNDQAAITCSRCGNEKETYENYCSNCEDEIENTCSRCGRHQYYINGGLCDDCEAENE